MGERSVKIMERGVAMIYIYIFSFSNLKTSYNRL